MLVFDYVDPAELTAFARELPAPANFVFDGVLPDVQVDDIEVIIDRVTRTNRAAKFRAYDAETPIGRRDSVSRDRVGLPPLGQKTVIGEYERLVLERLRGVQGGRIADAIYDDVALNTRAVISRMQLAKGDLIQDGKVTLAGENGLTIEYDAGVPATHFVAAATSWATATWAQIVADLRTWADVYTPDAGEPPARSLTSRRVVSQVVRAAGVAGIAGTGLLVSRGQINAALTGDGLPPFEEVDVRIDVDGVSTRPMADDRVAFLPANPRDLGYTPWGITAESLELAEASRLNVANAPGLTAVVLKEGDPVRIWTKVSAVGLPILTDPSKLLVADVL